MIDCKRHVTTPPYPRVDKDVHRKRSFLRSVVPYLATDPCLVSSWARRSSHLRSSVPQALFAWGVASGVPVQCTYVLVVCVVVGRSVTVDLLFLLGLIDARRDNVPCGEDIRDLVGQREQSAWWAHIGRAVALACGWWVGCHKSPLEDYTVNERAAPLQMARVRRSERESEADVGLAEVVHDVGA